MTDGTNQLRRCSIVLLFGIASVSSACGGDTSGSSGSDTGWTAPSEIGVDATDTGDGDPRDMEEPTYACSGEAVPCCDENGEYVTNADCTPTGKQCPAGTERGPCNPYGPDADGGTSELDLGPPTCDAIRIPCCDEDGEWVDDAHCTHDGRKCPVGSSKENCSKTPDADGGVPECDAAAVPCCDESGDYIALAECTDAGLVCLSGTNRESCTADTSS